MKKEVGAGTVPRSAADRDADDISGILDGYRTNHESPNPFGVRVRNSPVAGLLCRYDHAADVTPSSSAVNPAYCAGAMHLGDRMPRRTCFRKEQLLNERGAPMAQRIVRGPERARQGSKEGVVRYILIISTVLVVILFAVAYTLST